MANQAGPDCTVFDVCTVCSGKYSHKVLKAKFCKISCCSSECGSDQLLLEQALLSFRGALKECPFLRAFEDQNSWKT